jgi:hypothetical protein
MTNRRRPAQRGIAVFVMCFILIISVPVIGLVIDVTFLYIDKARLQGSVDGAALAGAKALARGSDDPTQQASAKQAAANYVFLNYPTTLFFTNSIAVNQTTDVTIDETVANQRTVTVVAHANIQTLFMRWLNFASTNINATATVTRRDVNIVMVVDRSGSLAASGSCAAVQQAAVNFVGKFANGRDNIGLITFAASTHDDFPIANNFVAASSTLPAPAQTVPQLINNMVCQSSTSSAMALWYAYDQLVGLNQPAALNIILFFTDGKPTGVNVNMPINVATSGCTQYHPAAGGNPPYINGLYNTYTNADQFFGISMPTNNGTIVSNDGGPTTDAQSGLGCNYMSGWPGSQTTISDFLGVPLTDVYGDVMNTGYLTPVTTVNTSYGTLIDINNPTNADYMAQNAADYAAQQIRAGANEAGPLTNAGKGLSKVIIYSIGLGNAPYPLSVPLLQRISNVTASTIYNSSEPTGDFILAPTSADIDAAFAAIASEILRIAK